MAIFVGPAMVPVAPVLLSLPVYVCLMDSNSAKYLLTSLSKAQESFSPNVFMSLRNLVKNHSGINEIITPQIYAKCLTMLRQGFHYSLTREVPKICMIGQSCCKQG